MKISEMTVGQSINTLLVLSKASTGSKGTKVWLNLTFTDGTDDIDAKLWDFKGDLPATQRIYDIIAVVTEYMQRKQLTVSMLSQSKVQDMSLFSRPYAHSWYDLWDEIVQRIGMINNGKLRQIVEHIYDTYKNELLKSTSAISIHHAGIEGNICHTIEVTDFAIAIYRKITGISVDQDLVIAGALVHDIGKIFAYAMNGPVIEYTESGKLLDHIVMGCLMLENVVTELGSDYRVEVELLQHIVASHHGNKEYGSPVTPLFLEAYLVNRADGLSATIDTIKQANIKAEREGKEYTDKLYTLENNAHFLQRVIYRMLYPND